MPTRNCPVCRNAKVLRFEVKTCSRWCSKIWMTWSPDTQAKAVELANTLPDELPTALKSHLDPSMTPEEETDMPSFLRTRTSADDEDNK